MWLIILWLCVFVVSLVALVKGSDYFTDAAEKIGLKFGLSPFLIGVTIVAVGTSIPELVASVLGVLQGHSEIVVGNVAGANIARILLVLGLTAIIGKRLTVARELIRVDLPFLVGSAFLMGFMVLDGEFTWIEGLLSLALLFVYMRYTIVFERRSDKEITREMRSETRHLRSPSEPGVLWHHIFVLLLSGAVIYLGGVFTVRSVIRLAGLFGTGTEIVAITAVALGTSLPELSVTIAAARKHKAEIALGIVLGSNVFNTFAIMGVSSLFGPLAIPDSVLFFSIPVMIASTFLYLFMTQDKEITKWEGWLLVIFYAFFFLRIIGVV